MEIGDPCQTNCDYNVNGCGGGGYTVQALWSNLQQRCVYPKAWRGVAYYTGSGNWQQLYVGEVRQVYASYEGLIATSNADPSELWEWSPNIQDIGPASGGLPFGSMFAIDGNDNVYAISYDQKNVVTTNLGGTGTLSWTNIVNNGATSIFAGPANGAAITWPGNNHLWFEKHHFKLMDRCRQWCPNQRGRVHGRRPLPGVSRSFLNFIHAVAWELQHGSDRDSC